MAVADLNTEECPSPEFVFDFAAGKILDQATQDRISAHVEACPKCLQRVAEADISSDPLLAHLRRLNKPSNWELADAGADRGCREALRRVLEIGNSRIDLRDRSTVDDVRPTLPDADLPETRHEDDFETRTIHNYQLIERIGSGGMGLVYSARHTRLNRMVAIKLLPSHLIGDDQVSRRFEREMQAVGQLAHPHIVAGYDAGEVDGHCFLAMELLRGMDLATLVKRHGGPISAANACELIRQAALGLQYAHQNGIIHRDVKPSNIMLCEASAGGANGSALIVKLLDLGLARFEQPDVAQETMTSIHQVMGTIDYMSPEQCLDSRQVDGRSDIYSLGATLFRLLVGRAPWAGKEFETQGQKLKALLSEQLPSIAEARNDLPDELVAIVDRALKHDPFDRFQAIGDMIDALKPLAENHDLDALLREATDRQPALPEGRLEFPADRRPLPDLPAGQVLPVGQPTIELKPPLGLDSHPPRPPGKTRKWLMLAGLPLALLLLSVIWIKTDGGYIRIEADESVEVTVEILKDGRKIDEVEIGRDGRAFWYRSGQYEIRLPASANDNLNIIGQKFSLQRGGVQVASIELVTEAEREAAKPNPTRPEEISWPDIRIGDPKHIVTSVADNGPGTLRAAIAAADPNDVIGFSADLSGQTIKLESCLEIDQSVKIDALPLAAGTSKTGITIDGDGKSQIFRVSQDQTQCFLRGLCLANGNLAEGTQEDNAAGGLIWAFGCDRLILDRCILEKGRAEAGGALFIRGGDLYVDRCEIRNNESEYNGGAFLLDSPVGRFAVSPNELMRCQIRNSTFCGNEAHMGGAIWCRKLLLRLSNVTFTKNQSLFRPDSKDSQNWNSSGGAMMVIGQAKILFEHCTMVGNHADHVGGAISSSIYAAEITLRNSIVAGNTADSSCNNLHDAERNSVRLGGGNLIGGIDGSDGQPNGLVAGQPTDTGDLVGTKEAPIDPRLSPLDEFGGPVRTMRPRSGSPVIDAVPQGQTFVERDVRGILRPLDGDGDGYASADIGAVEFDTRKDR